jgi:hypothetical protein
MESWQSSPLFEGDRFLWRSNRGRKSERRGPEIVHEAQKRGIGERRSRRRVEVGDWVATDGWGKELTFWVGVRSLPLRCQALFSLPLRCQASFLVIHLRSLAASSCHFSMRARRCEAPVDRQVEKQITRSVTVKPHVTGKPHTKPHEDRQRLSSEKPNTKSVTAEPHVTAEPQIQSLSPRSPKVCHRGAPHDLSYAPT